MSNTTLPNLQTCRRDATSARKYEYIDTPLTAIPMEARQLTTDACNYLTKRTIAPATATEYGLFSAQRYLKMVEANDGTPVNTLTAFGTPHVEMLVMPNSDTSYNARIPSLNYRWYGKSKGEEQHIFAFDKIYTDGTPKVLFVCEGEMDALTLLQHKLPAVSIGGTPFVSRFFDEHLTKHKMLPPVLICAFDNEESGTIGRDKMQAVLTANNWRGTMLNFWQDMDATYKDINELHVKDTDAFVAQIARLRVSMQDAIARYSDATDITSWSVTSSLPPTYSTTTSTTAGKMDTVPTITTTGKRGTRKRGAIATAKSERRWFTQEEIEQACNNGVHLFNVYLTRATITVGGKPTYVCPMCGQGEHRGRGAQLRQDGGAHLFCFGGCKKRYSPIDILREYQGYTFEQAVLRLLNQ